MSTLLDIQNNNAGAIAMLALEYFREFSKYFEFPANYTTIDVETSGLNPAEHLICTVGCVVVRDNKPEELLYDVLNWTDPRIVDQEKLRQDLENVEFEMRKRGKAFNHSYAVLSSGEDPFDVLKRYSRLFWGMHRRGEVLVSHNGLAFDWLFFSEACRKWLGTPLPDSMLMYDTGAIEKASQLPITDNPFPCGDEKIVDFISRIRALRRAGVHWNLDTYCDATYNLGQRVQEKLEGWSTDLPCAGWHNALFDALAIHCLFEIHRELAGVIAGTD